MKHRVLISDKEKAKVVTSIKSKTPITVLDKRVDDDPKKRDTDYYTYRVDGMTGKESIFRWNVAWMKGGKKNVG